MMLHRDRTMSLLTETEVTLLFLSLLDSNRSSECGLPHPTSHWQCPLGRKLPNQCWLPECCGKARRQKTWGHKAVQV